MTELPFVLLAGSERTPLSDAQPVGRIDPGERIEVTILTRRAASLPHDGAGVPIRLSRAELRQRYGSDPADHRLIAEVLARLEPAIQVTGSDPASRRLTVAGPGRELARVFGTELTEVSSAGPYGGPVRHRYRTGGLQIPAELDGVIVAVLGLDNRPQSRPQYRFADPAAVQTTYTPPQVASLYQFPAGTDGTGQTVAIIELGGGFGSSDLNTYFSSLGIPTPSVMAVGVDGASNVAGQDPQGADPEVLLDIEVIGAVAPGAKQLVYFAPNTDQGFLDAVTTAVHAEPTPVAVSISWGGPESSWTAQSMSALDQAIADGVALGVTVSIAAGDNGSSDGVSGSEPHVDFPASSPHALACGGTSMRADPSTGVISSETVWNDGSAGGATGGGVSVTFPLPAWQARAGVPASPSGTAGRGVPDIAGNADPATGYQVLVDGQQEVVGGTSAVAPLSAALAARLAQGVGTHLGLLQQSLYAGVKPGQPVADVRDITTGNNGAYSAGPGWDACSGLGVPIGSAVLAALSAAPPTTADAPGGPGSQARAPVTGAPTEEPSDERQASRSSGPSPADIDFVTGAPIDGADEPRWIHGAPSRHDCTDPAIQVHESDRHTFILRVSKAVSFEAPFIFLLFGNKRAILFDTGPSADPAKIPLRRTVDELVDRWLAEHPRDDYELVIAHTHGHHDHRDGDPQFAGRPHAVVVGHTAEEVASFYGFTSWPGQIVSFDLGGRVLELTGVPGHHPASVAVYDPWTGFLLTGDTIMPGRLYAKEYADFLQSLDRLLDFAQQRTVTRVLGCHIEMSRTPGRDYPAGNTYQPDELPLRLPVDRIAEIRDAALAATKPGVYPHGDFSIWAGGQRLAPMLGQAVRLLAYNWANRKQAKRG
jgi:kumamolisin